jgi:hypothetical protein
MQREGDGDTGREVQFSHRFVEPSLKGGERKGVSWGYCSRSLLLMLMIEFGTDCKSACAVMGI